MSPDASHHDGQPSHGGADEPQRLGVKDYTHRGLPKPAIESPAENVMEEGKQFLFRIVDTPTRWIREKIVLPLRSKNGPQVYYHRKFARVPTIDECEEGDLGCYFEANEQYKRDK